MTRAHLSKSGRAIVASTLLVLVAPILADVLLGWPQRLFGYVAADTFYYLVIGRESVDSGIIGYDGQHWSNGFHPLWQAIVAAVYALGLPGTRTHLDLAYVLGISLSLQVLAILLLAKTFRRRDGSLSPLFVGLPVGAYALLVSPAWLRLTVEQLSWQNTLEGSEPLYGTLWSYANGMESSLALACYAGILFFYCRRRITASLRDALVFGGLLAALAFARLDHAIFSVTIWFACAMRAWSDGTRTAARSFGATSGVFFGLLAIYLAVNDGLFGSALPVSGRVKTTAPNITWENFDLALNVHDFWLGASEPPIFVFWRVFQMLVPAVVALLSPLLLVALRLRRGILLCQWAGPSREIAQFLSASAVGVLGLAAYNFFFVPPFNQGHWYFPVSVLFVSLVVLAVAERASEWLSRVDRLPRRWSWLRAAGIAASVAAGSLAFFLRLHRHPDYHERFSRFYFEERPKILASLADDPPKLFCFEDGIVAYTTGFPSMSATGLALDAEAVTALEQGRLLDLAIERGFDHLTSLVYVDFSGLRGTPGDADIARWARSTGRFGDLGDRPIRVRYASEAMNFAIVEVGPSGR